MKKFLKIAILALLVIGLICSCDPNAKANTTVKSVSFNMTRGNTRGVDVSSEAYFDQWFKDAFDWYITATSSANNSNEPSHSISLSKLTDGKYVRTFFVGDEWTFSLYGVKKNTVPVSTTCSDILFESDPESLTFSEDVSANTVNFEIKASSNLKTGNGHIKLNLTYNPGTDYFKTHNNAQVILTVGEGGNAEVLTITDLTFNEETGILNTDVNNYVEAKCQDGVPVFVTVTTPDGKPLDNVKVRNRIYIYNEIETILKVEITGVNGSWTESGGGTVSTVEFVSFSFEFNEKDPNKEYSIVYKNAGGEDFVGTHEANYPTKHTYGTETNLDTPAREGYTFDGWYLNSDCTGESITVLGAEDYTEDVTLYAKWTEEASLLLSGVFTVGSNGKKVQFTRGYMYWDGDSFEIESRQFAYTSEWNANHVDCFYYSKNASIARAEIYSDSGASTSDILFTNETETTPKSDFTVAGETGKYRSLSEDEWLYLLKTRTVNGRTGEGKSYQRANVNGVNGLIIYPDDYTSQVENSYANNDWNTAPTVTENAWTTMAAAGCVFIPTAGYRNNRSLLGVGSLGYVWTASPRGAFSCDAYYMNCSNIYVSVFDTQERHNGQPVRLVADWQN